MFVDPPGPLLDVTWKFSEWGTVCYNLSKSVTGVPIIGEYLKWPFYYMYEKCYWVAHYLFKADQRIESLGWDEFIWSPGAWLLVRLGADIGSATHYRYRPWAWIIWKFRKEHLILDALLDRDFYWIGNYVLDRWPILREITLDPRGWVWDRVKERWWWVDELIYHPGRWFLVTQGADVGRAEYYQYQPWRWFIWKFRKEHLPIDALLDRDTRWLWNWITEAIDRYIDDHLDWVVSTVSRLLNKIWQMRVP